MGPATLRRPEANDLPIVGSQFALANHELRAADSRKGGWAELERLAAEKLENRLLDALDTYLEVMDNQGAPDQARLAAADRIVERLIGKVGERLTIHKQERAEVTVRYDVERLSEIVRELKALGAIDAEATECD